jgi:hypothetical protein
MKTKVELQEELDKQAAEVEMLRKLVAALADKAQPAAAPIVPAPVVVPEVHKETDAETALRQQLKNTADQLDKLQGELNLAVAERKEMQKQLEVVEKAPQPAVQKTTAALIDWQELRKIFVVFAVCVTVVVVSFFFIKERRSNPDFDKDRQVVILKQAMAEVSYSSRPINKQQQWTSMAEKLILISDTTPLTLQTALGEIRFYLEVIDQGNAWDTWRKNVGTKLLEETKNDSQKLQTLLKEAAAGLTR